MKGSMKKLKREIMNTVANFAVDVCLCNDKAMSKKDFAKYKKRYNEALEKSTNSIIALVWNSIGELL